MINLFTTELTDYKITLGGGGFRIELEYSLEAGSSPNFGRAGKITLIFYEREGLSNHFVKYSHPGFTDRCTIFLAPDKYLSVVDLLRNESPVYFHCRIVYTGRSTVPDGRHEVRIFSLSTDKEQIGEDDLDEAL